MTKHVPPPSLGLAGAVTAAVRELDVVEGLILSVEAAIENRVGQKDLPPQEQLNALQGADLARQMVADLASFLDELSALCPAGPNPSVTEALRAVRVHDVRFRLSGLNVTKLDDESSDLTVELFD